MGLKILYWVDFILFLVFVWWWYVGGIIWGLYFFNCFFVIFSIFWEMVLKYWVWKVLFIYLYFFVIVIECCERWLDMSFGDKLWKEMFCVFLVWIRLFNSLIWFWKSVFFMCCFNWFFWVIKFSGCIVSLFDCFCMLGLNGGVLIGFIKEVKNYFCVICNDL